MTEIVEKAQTDPGKYLGASITVIDGIGRGPKPRPFRQDQAVKQFCSWFYAAVMLNAYAFASVPLRLYVRKRAGRKYFRTREVPRRRKHYLTGGGDDRPSRVVMSKIIDFGSDFEEVTDPHPALKVLSSANPWQNGFDLSVLRMLYWQVTGNAYVHPVIDPVLKIPSELWIMPSQWMQIVPDRNNYIGGYVYGRRPNQVPFAPDEVIQWKLPSLADMFYGKGKAEALWDELSLHNAKLEEDVARADNKGRPDWLLIFKTGGDPVSLDRVEAKVQAKFQGSRNAGHFLSVAGDVDAVPLNFEQIEIGTPDKVIETIAAVTGTPIYKLRGNDPVKANSETQDTGWLRDTILPYCRMDEEQLNACYLPLFGIDGDAVLAYDNPVPENATADTERITKRVTGSLITVNEGRAALGEEPIEGGDVILVPAMMTTLDRVGQSVMLPGNLTAGSPTSAPAPGQPAPPAIPATGQTIQTTPDLVLNGTQISSATEIVIAVAAGQLPRDSGIGMLETFFNLTPEKAEQIMGSAGTGVATTPNPNPADVPTEVAPVAPATELPPAKSKSRVAPPPPSGTELIAVLEKFFVRQRAAVLETIKAKAIVHKDQHDTTPEKLPDGFTNLSDWNENLAREVQPIIEVYARNGAKNVLTRIGASDEVLAVVDRNIPKAAQELSLQLAESTNETTSLQLDEALSKLRGEIAEGLVSGDTIPELTTRVQTVFDQAEKSRAKAIAQTEASRARHEGQMMTARESGVVKKKVWLASADACDQCLALAAGSPDGIALGESFAVTDYGPVDAPPLHPHCACSVLFALDDGSLK